ncbi:MAG: TrkA family potassium uptake protein [Acidobacteriota bacterium]|nr:MAG: TrkA family potassium uptake protein [Acidobacteriota bacterium]
MASEFVVIGLGRFGQAVARSLQRLGQSVMVLDADQDRVQDASTEFDAAVCADATDERTIHELGLEKMAAAIVAIGETSIESSILVTALLRQLGVPRIVGRAVTDLHARVLLEVGAHEVVNPEQHAGERLGRRLAYPSVREQLDLGENAALAEIEAPESFAGRTLAELEVRRRHGVTVVGLRRGGAVLANLGPEDRIDSGDVLIVVGAPDALRRLAALS